ncbi:hypothetical protein JOQ06_021572 [Pogonophryne albipinna]|uniref:Beta/gamma crystallin 'Greek key' domain-containing protein n=1 Tax=Pogonophryne albipinna TaxID=1090488 RepID=A0AAD6F6I4_9TELE|nr:hypothetical protein JOQ06_021572 [Pogonophryne albipinna]
MGKITFYEERNFQGRSYECQSDCSDMTPNLSRSQSCRVESGCFMVYDRPNYMGNQFFLRRGEYSDNMSFGTSGSFRSCRQIPQHRGSFRIKIYEKENFGGQSHELMEDSDNIMERYRMSDCQSCNVMDGHWLMYEQAQFRGKMMYLRPGEYRSMREMGFSGMKLNSIIFYEDNNFQGRSYETSSDCAELTSYLSRCNSCRVESGCFMVYERPNYMGHQTLARRGEYPDNQRLMGMSMSDCICSCRMIPTHKGQFRMRIYGRENFRGQMNELLDDCDSIQDRFRMSDCQSAHVMDGHWLLYEQPQYKGRMLYLRPGEYRSMRDMGTGPMDMRIGSMRRIMDSC